MNAQADSTTRQPRSRAVRILTILVVLLTLTLGGSIGVFVKASADASGRRAELDATISALQSEVAKRHQEADETAALAVEQGARYSGIRQQLDRNYDCYQGARGVLTTIKKFGFADKFWMLRCSSVELLSDLGGAGGR